MNHQVHDYVKLPEAPDWLPSAAPHISLLKDRLWGRFGFRALHLSRCATSPRCQQQKGGDQKKSDHIWLVVDLPILKNMSSSMGRMTSHILWNIKKCLKPPTRIWSYPIAGCKFRTFKDPCMNCMEILWYNLVNPIVNPRWGDSLYHPFQDPRAFWGSVWARIWGIQYLLRKYSIWIR
jgi:hypothetical protein